MVGRDLSCPADQDLALHVLRIRAELEVQIDMVRAFSCLVAVRRSLGPYSLAQIDSIINIFSLLAFAYIRTSFIRAFVWHFSSSAVYHRADWKRPGGIRGVMPGQISMFHGKACAVVVELLNAVFDSARA